MGLDKRPGRVFDRYMGIKLLLTQLGFGEKNSDKKAARLSPYARERQTFERDVRQQFLELKKKGLSIPVFTL